MYAGDVWSRLALVVAVGACNAFYGIEGTKLIEIDADPCPNDRDCDGLIDSVDFCPDVGDGMQTDIDGDGVGDSCDPCSATLDAAVDEDGDGISPAIDRCPGANDPNQQDTDGDGVGDACDPATSKDRLICWADFAPGTNVAVLWPLAGPWSHQASLIVHVPATTDPQLLGTRTAGLPAEAFAVQTGIDFDITDTDFATGIAVGPSGGPAVQCVVARTPGQSMEVRLVVGGATVATSPISVALTPVRVTLSLTPDGATCGAQPPGESLTSVTAAADVAGPTVFLIARSSHATFNQLATYALDVP